MRNLFSPKQIIQTIILSQLIKEGPLHGYGLTSAIEKKFGWKPNQTAIYKTLKTLEANKSVISEEKVENGRAQKIYTITETGRDFMTLAQEKMFSVMGKRLSQILSIMQDFSEIECPGDSPEGSNFREMAGKNMDLLPIYVFKLMHVAPEATIEILETAVASLQELAALRKIDMKSIEDKMKE